MAPARRRLIVGVVLFVLGFAVVFISYGAVFGAAGYWLVRWQGPITRAMGIFVIVMGLAFIGVFSFFQRTIKPRFAPSVGLAGTPLLGLVFGVGWTQCLRPRLTAISLLSLSSGSSWRGALQGLFYCVGLGVPFPLVDLGLDWLSGAIAWLKRHIRAINIADGTVLIVIGGVMVTGIWTMWICSMHALISGFVLPI